MDIHNESHKHMHIALAVVLIALAFFGRVLPHPANFTPLAAVAIFGGVVLPRRWAVTLPLVGMVLSDLVIGLHPLIAYTWGSFALIAIGSSWLMKKVTVASALGASLSASVLFFVVSNFGVWAEGRLYDRTLSGLVSCYYNALPFFRGTVLGDLVFVGMLFGAYALAVNMAAVVTRPKVLAD